MLQDCLVPVMAALSGYLSPKRLRGWDPPSFINKHQMLILILFFLKPRYVHSIATVEINCLCSGLPPVIIFIVFFFLPLSRPILGIRAVFWFIFTSY